MGLIKSLINEGAQFAQYQKQHRAQNGGQPTPGQSTSSSRAPYDSSAVYAATRQSAAGGYPSQQYTRNQPVQAEWSQPQHYRYDDRGVDNKQQGFANDRKYAEYSDHEKSRVYSGDRKSREAYSSNVPTMYDAPPSYSDAEAAPYQSQGAQQQRYASPGLASGANPAYAQSSRTPSRSFSLSNGDLTVPVIIPPQRPGNVGRGFRPAYAPDLESVGIDQTTFLHFLHDLNEGCTDSKALMPLQVACFGAGLAPSMIAMAVTTGVSMAATAANQGYVRHKVNAVLDNYNQDVFMPHGVYVLIMKFDPTMGMQSSGKGRGGGGLGSLIGAVGSMAISQGGSKGGTWSKDYTAGSAGSDDLPTEAAQLVFLDDDPEWLEMKSKTKAATPRRDGTPTPGTVTPEKKPEGKFSHFMKNFDGYLDQRARNNYLAENGESVLTRGSGATIPTKLFGDDDKKRNGRDRDGRYGRGNSRDEDDRQREYDRYNQERDRVLHDRRSPQETERELRKLDDEFESRMRDLDGRRNSGSSNSAPQKKITKNVIYIMIVNKPSQEQMDMADSNAYNMPVAMVQA